MSYTSVAVSNANDIPTGVNEVGTNNPPGVEGKSHVSEDIGQGFGSKLASNISDGIRVFADYSVYDTTTSKFISPMAPGTAGFDPTDLQRK